MSFTNGKKFHGKKTPSCTLTDFAKSSHCHVTYQTLLAWAKKSPLPKPSFRWHKSKKPCDFYAIDDLKNWYAECQAGRGNLTTELKLEG